jgi:hypothetical protein
MMKGCPFNNFGECRQDDCMFFLPEDSANRFLRLFSPPHKACGYVDDRCLFVLNFSAAQEVLNVVSAFEDLSAYYGQSMLAHYRLDLHPFEVIFEILKDHSQKLESLEKELKKP